MPGNELVEILNTQLGIDLPQIVSSDELEEKVSEVINYLLVHDFKKLVYILYKIDVSEVKLKQMLAGDTPKNTSLVIARLIIERQQQKLESRKKFRPLDNISEEEKW